MGERGISAEVAPGEVGLDEARLDRIAEHFDSHVAAGRFPGWLCAVARDRKVAWVGAGGLRDVEHATAVTPDTIWRIYSMTKPVTSLAAMLLHEEGSFDLYDEVATYLPEFAAPVVYVDGTAPEPLTRPVTQPIRVWHLLTHTAGLTYGFQRRHAVDEHYRDRGYDWGTPRGRDLAAATSEFALMPLQFDPGTAWNYSVATDVVGRLVEVWSGRPLDEFLSERIFEPLDMLDTGFHCPEGSQDRLAALYLYLPDGTFAHGERLGAHATRPPRLLSGGGGLVSTASDYHRFATMLLNGGELEGARICAPSTVELMSRNHLPGGADLERFAVDGFAEPAMSGVGFGLGLATVIDAARLKLPVSAGTISWGGAASTTFWVDPAQRLSCVFFTQLLPSTAYQVRRELQRLVYQAILA